MATEMYNLSLADVEKLNDTNFTKWKSAVQDQLEVFELWDYTQTEEPPAAAAEDDIKVFASKQRKTLALLRTRMEERAHALVKGLTNACEAWKLLEKSFKAKGSGQLTGRLRKLMTTTLGDSEGDTTKYATAFRKAIASLNSLSDEFRLNDNVLIYFFHEGLGPEYELYRDLYGQTHDAFDDTGKPKYSLTYAMERFANQMAGKDTSAQPAVTLAAVRNGSAFKGNTRMVGVKHCTHCGKDYHNAEECRQLHPELKHQRDGGDNQRGNNKRRREGRNSGSSGRNNNNSGNQQGQQANQNNNQTNTPSQTNQTGQSDNSNNSNSNSSNNSA